MRTQLIVLLVVVVSAVGCGGSAPLCGPSNCLGCCSSVGVCHQGQDLSACGANGATCDLCTSAQVCTAARQCAFPGGAGSSGGGAGGGTAAGGGAGGGTADACAGVSSTPHCLDASRYQYCAVSASGGRSLSQVACAAGQACAESGGRASCVSTSPSCTPGARQCQGTSLATCNASGVWTTAACQFACRSTPAGDFCAAAAATASFSGTVSYEARLLTASHDAWGDLAEFPAPRVLVVSAHAGRWVDATVTSSTGAFTLAVPAAPDASDVIEVSLLAYDSNRRLVVAMADPGFSSGGEYATETTGAPQLWSWAWDLSGLSPGSGLVVDDANFGAAVKAFGWIASAAAAMEQQFGRAPKRLLVWAAPDVTWDCGACFGDGSTTQLNAVFGAQMYLGHGTGEELNSNAVTVHESGHWVMASFGTSPHEAGPHYAGHKSLPGMAWSEGWATYFSSLRRNSSLYYDVGSSGGFFWFDIGSRTYDTLPWHRPTAAAGLFQQIDENEVAAELLALSKSSTSAPGDIFTALASTAMNQAPFGRGYTRHGWDLDANHNPTNIVDYHTSAPCFADLLDALVCAGFSPAGVDAVTQPSVYFPYPSSAPICH